MSAPALDRNDEAIRTYGIAMWATFVVGAILLTAMALYFP